MADNSNGWHFKRGLENDFMKELESIAEQGGWFAQVLADPDLILGIRNNYLNVYWHGQSLFKIKPHGKFSTHPKYLIDPGLSKAVMFDGTDFQVEGHNALTAHYDGKTTLKKMKGGGEQICRGREERSSRGCPFERERYRHRSDVQLRRGGGRRAAHTAH